MKAMSDKITLMLENGTFKKHFIEDGNCEVLIYLNDFCIGSITGHSGEDYIHIELIEIDEKYRGKGFGYIALEKLKEIAKGLGIKFIDGECNSKLKNFYKKLGAKFECREAYDENFILNKFYIDL